MASLSPLVWTAADLRYDPTTHTSTTPDGQDVPHVTHVLRAVGVSVDFEGLAARSGRLAAAIDERRALGTIVHADAHAYDDLHDGETDLVWESVDPRVEPYVRAWATCRANLGLIPLTRERRVYHAGLGYTGILDGIFKHAATGRRVLADLKIGDPESAGCRYQLAAYEAAYVAEHPDADAIDERWGIQLTPERTVPYRVTNYSAVPNAWMDGRTFQAFMTTYWAQAERRRHV